MPSDLHRVADCHGAADRSLRAVEHRQEAVTRGVDLATAKSSELRSDDGVVRIQQGMPVTVTHLRGPARRVHDVGEQHRGKNPIIGHVSLLPGEELGDLLKRRRHGSTKWYMLRPGSSTYFAP